MVLFVSFSWSSETVQMNDAMQFWMELLRIKQRALEVPTSLLIIFGIRLRIKDELENCDHSIMKSDDYPILLLC